MKTFFICPNWYSDQNPELFTSSSIKIKSGVTVLVGCNGAGKTTLIHQIMEQLHKNQIPFIGYDNLLEGGSVAMRAALEYGNTSFLATAAQSSEGEKIIMCLGNIAVKIRNAVKKAVERGSKELWVFLDATDSGLSIDNIVHLKNLLHMVEKDCKENSINPYIIVSSNSYELANGESCLDVISGRYVTFSSYETYREHILQTAQQKAEREEKHRSEKGTDGE